MTDVTWEYLEGQFREIKGQFARVDEQFAQVNRLIETLASATAERFDGVDAAISEVRADARAIKGRLDEEATETDVAQQNLRRLRETVEENHAPRLSNLEAQIGKA